MVVVRVLTWFDPRGVLGSKLLKKVGSKMKEMSFFFFKYTN